MNELYIYRHTILAQLEASFPMSLALKTLVMGLNIAGFNCENIEKQLEYLEQKKFIEIISCEICPSFKRYKITAYGIDFLNGGVF